MIGEGTNHLWQSTLFAVVAGLLTVAFRKNRAQVRYWLWLTASFKFFIPFSLMMSLGSHLEWAPVTKKIATASVSFTMVEITQSFPGILLPVPSRRGTRDWVSIALLGVWTCGFAGVARIRIRGWHRIRAAVRASCPIDIPATVEVRCSPGLLEPGVVGLFHPILLVPAGIAERLEPRQLEAVLVHELCHVRRRDNLTAAIHMIVEAVFWFHPLVWWIGARLVEERERACDEEVLRLGSEPRDYAEGILKVCQNYWGSPLSCVSGVTGANLKKRIQTILTGRVAGDLNFAKKVALAVAGMAALAAPIVIGMMNAPAIRAQAKSSSQSGTAATPKFEMASIRPGCVFGGGGPFPGRLNLCDSLGLYIQRAYVQFANGHRNPRGYAPIEGGPVWIYDRYQINAKVEGNVGEETMMGPMLQALLEDRFKLKIHRETREVPVYALTVARSGLKLPQFKEGSCVPDDFTQSPPLLAPGEEFCPAGVSSGTNPMGRRLTLTAHGLSLDMFSEFLTPFLDRPVINRAGITGSFDFDLEFASDKHTPNLLPPAAPSDEPVSEPSIFTALKQQLGLQLKPAKGLGEFLVIDHVEKPSER